MLPLITDDDYGILVGTGTTAETSTDYQIETKIAHGTGSGQLQYAAGDYTAAGVSGSYVEFEVRRTFTNGSGASITVQEAVIYCKTWGAGAYRYFCIARDLTGGVSVPDGQVLTVKYIYRTLV